KQLLEKDCHVIGIDNLNEYYDVNLKQSRLDELTSFENFTFIKGDISDKELTTDVFKQHQPSIVVNLAAQAGVRYSLENPDVYMQSNVTGFFNILEACRHYQVDHLIYESYISLYSDK